MRTASLVINPTTVQDPAETTALVRERGLEAGWDVTHVRQTSPEDSGRSAARDAVRRGAQLVLCCGGDGTLAATAAGLVNSAVPMGILSTGSGNLLSRNLGIPLDVHRGLDVAFDGHAAPLDVGDVDGSTFLVMAGMGFDAAIMAEAAGPAKDRWGWLAYVAAGVKRLRSEAMTVDVTADGRTVVADRRARTVIVGNVGHLQGGIALLPDADPRDGLLDVAVVAPRRLTDWLAVARRILLRRTGSDARLTLLRAEDVHVHSRRPHPRQFDGEVLEPARSLRATVQPAALLVKVPAL